MNDYPWTEGVFNAACVCGGSINRPNADCERCAMHAWIYKQADEIESLRAMMFTKDRSDSDATSK